MALRGRCARSVAASSGVSGISRAPWRDLGGHDRALDDRATHPQMRRVAVEDEVAPAQPDRLGDPQPGRGEQLEQRPPLRRDLLEQAHQLRARQKASLARRPCATRPPPRQHDLLGRVGIQQPLGDRRVKRQAQRRERVGDRAITQPPGAPGAGRQPIHELLHSGAIEIPHPNLTVEIGQRQADQQATVLTARVGAHAVMAGAGVAIKPRQAEPCSVGPRRSARASPSRCSLIARASIMVSADCLRWRPPAR
jgi:hypothetical protein